MNKSFFITLFFINSTATLSTSGKNLSILYAHGIAANHEQAYWYVPQKPDGTRNKHHFINGRLFAFDFPDATNRFWRVNFTQSSLGQANEIMSLYKAFFATQSTLRSENQSQDVILMGLSRGAATVLTFMGLFNLSQIKAVIAESPFDSMHEMVNDTLKRAHIDKLPGVSNVTHALLSYVFMQHAPKGISPRDVIANINKKTPVFLVCSKEDRTVPWQRTAACYKTLIDAGHKEAYILILEKGKHSQILSGPQGEIYQNAVHAFFKKCELHPYDPTYAAQGVETLEKCQPTAAQLAELLK